MQRIRVIDSHTGGEPTRVIVDGGPDLGAGQLDDRREKFRNEFDTIRSAVVNEPRGFDAIVGALLCKPHDPTCDFGVIFFNNVGYIGMCVHGSIGLAATLAHMGHDVRAARIETPVGVITISRDADGTVTVGNVPSFRWRTATAISVDDYGEMHGDVAWGGNWFFLVNDHGQEIAFRNREGLRHCCRRIRAALVRQRVTGKNAAEIDHVELFGPATDSGADSKNFVLCPGGEYDRSPCGTGTSAKVACLVADGRLAPGEIWRQEGIVGSVFESWGEVEGDHIRPFIRGEAYVTAESELIVDPRDPLRHGIT